MEPRRAPEVHRGLRYWHDTREGSYFGTAPEVPGLTPPVTIIFGPDQIFPDNPDVLVSTADAERDFDDVTARVELDYRVSDSALLYVSYNRGSKSGGYTFSTGTPYNPNEEEFLNGIPFEPETLNAYEVGLKSNIGDSMMLNLSAFYYDYKDYQAFAQLGPVQTVINQDAEAQGLEIELNAYPTDRLALQLGASFMDSEVKDILLPDLVTVVDHDLPQAPSVSANALARYEFPLAGGTASIQGDVLYTDDFCFTVLCAPVEAEESYTVANARIGYASPRRPLGGRRIREQPVRGGVPRVRLRQLAVLGRGCGRLRQAAHLRRDGERPVRGGVRLTRAGRSEEPG